MTDKEYKPHSDWDRIFEPMKFKEIFYGEIDGKKKLYLHPLALYERFIDWANDNDRFYNFTMFCWYVERWIKWLKEPRGVHPQALKDYQETVRFGYVLKSYYDAEDFDADGVGDIYYVKENYEEFETLEDVLKYLKSNIKNEDGTPPKLDTVEEYCQEYAFELYERKY
tara:strand:- start:78 stop:581 length:504 start_codon:yes stop_codon:yes gene_type:complete